MNTQQGSPKAVVFDVDGTLIDSVDVHAQAWVDAFAEFGHEFRFADVRRQIGKGGDQLMPVFLSKAEIDRFGERLEERRGVLLKERYLHRIKPFPGRAGAVPARDRRRQGDRARFLRQGG